MSCLALKIADQAPASGTVTPLAARRSEMARLRPPRVCPDFQPLKTFTAVVERDPTTGLLVGYVPGLAGAHTQAEFLDELRVSLREVVELVFESGEPQFESEFVGTQTIQVA